MRRSNWKKFVSAAALTIALAGCTLFSIGPLRVEIDLPPTATIDPNMPTPVATSGIRPTAQIIPTATVDVNAADLIIETAAAVGSGVNPRCGENTRVDFTVRNIGAGVANANTLYLTNYADGVLTNEAFFGFTPLQPGEAFSSSLNIVIPGPPNIVHRLFLLADGGLEVAETDETNNGIELIFNLDDAGGCPPPSPIPPTDPGPTGTNLIMEAVTITGSGVNPRCGETSRVDFTVRNAGAVAAVASTVGFDDTVQSTSEVVGTLLIDIPPLDGGQTYSASADIVIAGPPNVFHSLRAFADYHAVVPETNDGGDNLKVISFNVDDSGNCG